MTRAINLGNNIKGVRLDDLPPEAWNVVVGPTEDTDLVKLYSRVAWLWRGVQLRANGVASMPFEIRNSAGVVYDSTKDKLPPAGLEWVRRLPVYNAKVEAAATLRGAAYFERRQNVMGSDLFFDWLLPDSVTPQIHKTEGLTGFKRQVGSRTVKLETEDVVYFWLPDWRVELGPALDYPGKAALSAAGVLHGAAEFLAGYFDRGLIKATLLTYDHNPTPEEAGRVLTWWKRVFSGVKNANAADIIRGDFKPIIIGEGLKDLTDNNLTTEQREDISAALGVPQSKLFKKPGGLGDAQDSDNRTFYDDTLIPETEWIRAVWNEQVLEPDGYTLVYTPQKLSVFQEDEEQRSQSFLNYVNGNVPNATALAMLGVTVPEGMPVESLPVSEPADNASQRAELANLRRYVKRGQHKKRPFRLELLAVSDVPEELRGAVATQDSPFQSKNSDSATRRLMPY
jgi:hypothetical protein